MSPSALEKDDVTIDLEEPALSTLMRELSSASNYVAVMLNKLT